CSFSHAYANPLDRHRRILRPCHGEGDPQMSSPTIETRERVVRLEEQVKNLEAKITSMDTKVTEMHSLLLQARGMKWTVMVLVALGGFVAAKVVPLVSDCLPPKEPSPHQP